MTGQSETLFQKVYQLHKDGPDHRSMAPPKSCQQAALPYWRWPNRCAVNNEIAPVTGSIPHKLATQVFETSTFVSYSRLLIALGPICSKLACRLSAGRCPKDTTADFVALRHGWRWLASRSTIKDKGPQCQLYLSRLPRALLHSSCKPVSKRQ